MLCCSTLEHLPSLHHGGLCLAPGSHPGVRPPPTLALRVPLLAFVNQASPWQRFLQDFIIYGVLAPQVRPSRDSHFQLVGLLLWLLLRDSP